jgi:uncharacterized protein (TIGR02246 family)
MARRSSLLALFSILVAPALVLADPIEDRIAITDALFEYGYRWDAKDAEGLAALFTDDGVMERRVGGVLLEGSRVSGRRAILAYARNSHAGRLADRQSRHHFSGVVFRELGADHAVTEHVALITHQTATDETPIVVLSGVYRNTWRRTAEGWRISERVLSVDRAPDRP